MNTATYIVVPLSLFLNFVLFVGLSMRSGPSDPPISESPRTAQLFVDIQQLGTPLPELQSRLDELETEIERRTGTVTDSANAETIQLVHVPLDYIRDIRDPGNPDTLSAEIFACMDDPQAEKELLELELGSLYNEIIKRKKELVSTSTVDPMFGKEFTIGSSPVDIEKFAERYRQIFRRYMRDEIANVLVESATNRNSLVGKFARRETISLDSASGRGRVRITSESGGSATLFGGLRRGSHYANILELEAGD